MSNLYQFGAFRLDTQEQRLLSDGKPVPLTPKSFELLRVLVENPGRLLHKDELLKLVWPDSYVEEGNLSHHVFALRKALWP
jgi:DNA-binding winged helix-turn-helix (wHTH) protein